jgi:hypothetical protein
VKRRARRPVVSAAVVEALQLQRSGFAHRSLASPLYGALLDTAIADVGAGGICAEVLVAAPADVVPIPDALVLRFLGAVHRIVLEGRAPGLAAWFPTAGGTNAADGPDLGPVFLETVAAHRAEIVAGLSRGVQTNEVGRCAVLAVGFTALLRRWGLPLRLLEIGAAAGLNLRWDRWRYESDASAWGDPGAAVCFGTDVYREPRPHVGAPLGPGEAVVERLGCDRAPIDPRSDEGRLTLRSYVWPDQADRHARLDAGLAVAAQVPATVVRADAGDWVADQLAERREGVTTVVYHSIVWQYVPAASRQKVEEALVEAGGRASSEAPVAWLRMEPGPNIGDAAELRLRAWPLGEDGFLARSGYHGRPVWRT